MGRLKRHLYLLGQQTRDHVKMVAEFPSVGRRSLQRVGFAYLLGLVLLTVLFFLVRSLAPPLGLSRSFYASLDPGIAPLFEARATTVDLAFVDDRDDLPTQFHRVRWDGIWFSPRQEVVEFRAGADDSVVVTLDGEEVLRRNPRVGMHAVSRAVTLDAGPHRLEIDYEQGPGGRSLNVQWAPASGTPGPLYPGRLFDHDPGWSGFWLATVTIGLQYVVVLAWLGGAVVVVVLWLGGHAVRWYRAARVMTARDLRSRLHVLSWPALLLASVPFLIGTHTIYASNLGEFSLPFRDMAAPWLLAVVGVTWGLLTAPGCLLSDRLVRVYAATLFGLSLLFWAQGNLWVGDYGVLDGSEIDFDRLAWRTPYELAIWTAVPAAAVAFGRRVSRIAPLASQVFLGVQVVAILAGQNAERQARWVEAPPEIHQFSSQQNVVFVVLDAFQSDVFAEFIELDRSWFDERFSGFVFFEDHASTFPTTSLSMPAVLTGQTYRNAKPVPLFVRDAFGDTSILRGLHEHGYEIDVTSILQPSWLDDWFAGGDEEGGLDVTRMTIRKPYVGMADYRRLTARQLIELSVFRHVPHVAKEALEKHPDWFTRVFWAESQGSVADERRHLARNSQVFFSQFIDNVTVDRDRPLFKLIHLGIPHRPVVVDENCRYVGRTRFTRESYLGQARCAVDLVATFLDRLRTLGVYDESVIIVLSDHGIGIEPRGFAGESGSLPRQNGGTTVPLTSMAGRAKALMLVKPPGRDGPLVISQAPTTHTDVPVTIFDILGLSHAFEGVSMLKRDPTQARRRTYGNYGMRGQRFPEGYLARLDVVTIERDLLDGSGWVHQRSLLPPDLELTAQTIDLGTDDADLYLGPGWSRNGTEEIDGREVTFAWGLGRQATVFASLPSGTAQLTARLSAAENRAKVVELEVDGRRLGRITVRGEPYQDVMFQIPPDPDRPRISSLVLRFRSTSQPDAPGVRVDRISFQSN